MKVLFHIVWMKLKVKALSDMSGATLMIPTQPNQAFFKGGHSRVTKRGRSIRGHSIIYFYEETSS